MSATKPPPRHDTTPLSLPSQVGRPGDLLPETLNAWTGWALLNGTMARTIPTQDVNVRRMIRAFPGVLVTRGR